MLQKLLLIFLGGAALATFSVDLTTVRENYQMAYQNEKVVKKLHGDLTAVGKNDRAILVAYKGAVMTMMADYEKDFKHKKTLFKEGRELLEHAVETDSKNVEVRCIRLSVQEHVPKITGYTKNREEDKQFIIGHFDSMEESGAKEFVSGFVSRSDSFTEAEKQAF